MSTELQEFFSLIGKAKKEKEDEFKSLVGDINIDSLFTQVKQSVKEEKNKKEKQEKQIQRQVKALEAWLYAEPIKEKIEELKENKKEEKVVKNILPEETELLPIEKIEEPKSNEIITEDILINTNNYEHQHEHADEDTIDYALKILGKIKTKEEIQENIKDPEIIKIRRELEYLKNLVNAQGGGGEVRLEFLDDIDRSTAKTNDFYLKYDSSLDKWVGAAVTSGGGSGGTQTLNQTLSYGNTSNLGMSVGVITSTNFIGPLTGNASSATYATSAGIATYATTAGISTVSQGLTGTPNITVGSIIASSATISGNVSIGGTLIYEDVANVDSIGIVTARSGVEIGSGTNISIISLQAVSSTTTTLSSTSIDTFDINIYRSAQYQIQITRGTLYHLTTLNVLHDGTDVYISEFGTIKTSEPLASFDADINSGSVRILVIPTSDASTVFKISKVLTKI